MQQLTLVGHLGGDPEVRYTTSGDMVANFNVATTEKWKDKQGNKQEKTTWFTVTAWREKAKLVSDYLTKGSQVMILGKLTEPKPWIDGNSNQARCRLEMSMDQIHFLGGGTRQDNGNTTSRPATASNGNGRQGHNEPEDNGPTDEDIPF